MFQDSFHQHLTSLCQSHPTKFLTHICTSSSCSNRLLCQSCIPFHNRQHKHSLVPTKELLDDKILDVMDLKAKSQFNDDERFNKANALLEKIEHSLEVMMGLMKNSAFKIHRKAKEYREKIRARAKPKYNSQDWARFKDYFILNKKNFLASEAGKLSPELESFAVHYGGIISKIDEDSTNILENEIASDIPIFDKFGWEEVITISLKGIEDHYKDLFSKVFPTGPEKKLIVQPVKYSVSHRAREAKVGSMEMSSIGITPKSATGGNAENFSTRNTDFAMAVNFSARKSAQVSRRPDFELNIVTTPEKADYVSSGELFKSSPRIKISDGGFGTARDTKAQIGQSGWDFNEKGSYTARYEDFTKRGNEKLMIKGKFELSFGLVPSGVHNDKKSHYKKEEPEDFDILNVDKKFVSDNELPYK